MDPDFGKTKANMVQGSQAPHDGVKDDPIQLSALPPKRQEQARWIMGEIAAGISHTRFHGKRLAHDRLRISVPLGKHWRLLFKQVGRKLVPIAAMSHSDYNGRKPGRRRTGKKR